MMIKAASLHSAIFTYCIEQEYRGIEHLTRIEVPSSVDPKWYLKFIVEPIMSMISSVPFIQGEFKKLRLTEVILPLLGRLNSGEN